MTVLCGAANDSRAYETAAAVATEPQLSELANANSIRTVDWSPGLAETITSRIKISAVLHAVVSGRHQARGRPESPEAGMPDE